MPHRQPGAWRTLAGALMLSCLMLSLTACGRTITRTEIVQVPVCDVSDLERVDPPALAGNTNRDVWVYAIEAKGALNEANARIEAAVATCEPLP